MKQTDRVFYPEASDEALALDAKAGNPEAVEQLILRYIPLVRYLAQPYQRIGIEFDDLEQEGLIGLFKAVRKFNPTYENSFKTFASRCITNKIISAVNTFFRGKNLPMKNYLSLSDLDEPTNLIQNKVCDPQEIFIEHETVSSRKQLITSLLSQFEQDTLKLYLSGYSYAQMAKELSASAKSVDNSLQRIRRKLRSVESRTPQ